MMGKSLLVVSVLTSLIALSFQLNLPKLVAVVLGGGEYNEPEYANVIHGAWAPPGPEKSILGYQCKTDACANEALPGSLWNTKCRVKNSPHFHYCIPFIVDKSLNDEQMVEVYRAMQWMRLHTCVAWVYRKNESDYVKFSNGNGCSSSSLGKSGGEQRIELGPGCYEYPSVVFHELMHTVGFEHLHQREDRDKYIDIDFKNIDQRLKPMFVKKSNVAGTQNVTFDYSSVLLYGSTDFQNEKIKGCTDPKCYTISRKNGGRILSVYQKVKPAKSDYYNINSLYDCFDEEFGIQRPRKRPAPGPQSRRRGPFNRRDFERW